MKTTNNYHSKMKYLCLGWYLDFKCPGGNCGLTCCSSEWNISLKDDEIKMYDESSHPFMDTFRTFIDYANHKMKCNGDTCAALDNDGYCTLVSNCGPEFLSKTCQTFPRRPKVFGDITEMWVEISCPIVAKNLLINTPIDFSLTESDNDVVCNITTLQLYDQLSPMRLKLIELFGMLPGQFVSGKIFLTVQQIKKYNTLIQTDSLSKESSNILVSQLDDNTIEKTLVECEQLNNNTDLKVNIIHTVLRSILSDAFLLKNLNKVFSIREYLIKHINCWTNDIEQFKADLVPYTKFVNSSYPLLKDNYLVYTLFTSWIVDNVTAFGNEFSARMVELLIIQLCAMALWKETGDLNQDEFSILIAAADRRTEHVANHIEKILSTLQSIDIDEDILLTMMII